MTVPTLLPIYSFGKVLGLNPLHLMGVDANIGTAQSRVCIHPIQQYSWQDSDGVSREELSQAIADAEQELSDYLGYWPAPTWTQDERIELVDTLPGSWPLSGYDVRGDRMSVKARYGELISGGKLAYTLIQAGAAVVYTDVDGDGYKETATLTINGVTVVDPEEIALYYPSLLLSSGDDLSEWEIRPIHVSLNTTTQVAVITCRREQLVKKELLESLDPATAISGTTDGNFLTTCDVYRKYNDPSVQIQMQWRNAGPFGCLFCDWDTTGCETCSLSIQTGCMTVKNKSLGIVTLSPATWDATTSSYTGAVFDVCRRPDNVRLWYRSGWRDMSASTPELLPSREWQRVIAKLAISKLDRQICSCKAVSDVQSHYNTDLRRNVGTREKSTTYRVTPYELEANPFGTTIAAMDVWRFAKRRTLGL